MNIHPGQGRITSHQWVVNSLRRAMLSGELAPGTRLVIRDIAEELGVSTTPVREAIRDLSGEGFVEFDAYKGAVVKSLTFDEVLEIYEIRSILESVAMEKALNVISDAELDELDEFLTEMEQETDVVNWVEMNRVFHFRLTAPAGSEKLETILDNLRDLAASVVAWSIRLHPERMQEANRDHRDILDAMRRRRKAELLILTKSHLESTVEALRCVHEAE